MNPREFLDAVEDDKVIAAIHRAEALISVTFRVHVSHQSAHDAFEAAGRQLKRLKAHRDHNGRVLIFISPESRTFALLGDAVVHAKVPQAEWDSLSESLTARFKNGDLTAGLVDVIESLADRIEKV